jgi:hypothetical protein
MLRLAHQAGKTVQRVFPPSQTKARQKRSIRNAPYSSFAATRLADSYRQCDPRDFQAARAAAVFAFNV